MPDLGRAAPNLDPDTGFQLLRGHIIFDPAAAIGLQIGDQRLYAVDGFGEDGVVGLGGFKLFPEGAVVVALVGGQDAKDAVRSFLFLDGLNSRIGAAVDGGIACVNLDDVVQEDHLDHAPDVDGAYRMFSQRQSIKGDVPAMFGGVFAARGIAKGGGALDGLQPVGLGQKGQLAEIRS